MRRKHLLATSEVFQAWTRSLPYRCAANLPTRGWVVSDTFSWLFPTCLPQANSTPFLSRRPQFFQPCSHREIVALWHPNYEIYPEMSLDDSQVFPQTRGSLTNARNFLSPLQSALASARLCVIKVHHALGSVSQVPLSLFISSNSASSTISSGRRVSAMLPSPGRSTTSALGCVSNLYRCVRRSATSFFVFMLMLRDTSGMSLYARLCIANACSHRRRSSGLITAISSGFKLFNICNIRSPTTV